MGVFVCVVGVQFGMSERVLYRCTLHYCRCESLISKNLSSRTAQPCIALPGQRADPEHLGKARITSVDIDSINTQ